MNTTTITFLREMAIILGVSAILALSYNAFSPKPLPLVRTETVTVASDSLITALAQKPDSSTLPAQSFSESALPSQDALTPKSSTNAPLGAVPPSQKTPLQQPAPQSSSTPNSAKTAPQAVVAQSTPQVQTNPTPATANAKALEIRFDQVEKLLQNPDVLFIDARPKHEFDLGHIGSAISIYTPEFEQNIPRVIGLPRDKPIVAYCGGGACELSHELADNLLKMGFTRVFVYVGGWNEWKQKRESLKQ